MTKIFPVSDLKYCNGLYFMCIREVFLGGGIFRSGGMHATVVFKIKDLAQSVLIFWSLLSGTI